MSHRLIGDEPMPSTVYWATSKVIAVGTVLRVDPDKLWRADFEGGSVPSGFAPSAVGAAGASGSASIRRDCVLTIAAVRT